MLPDWMHERHRLALQELRRGRVTPTLLETRRTIDDGTDVLTDLVTAGYASQLDGTNLYELVTDPADNRAWFHFICSNCDRRQELTLPSHQITRTIDAETYTGCPDCGTSTEHRLASVSSP